MYDDKTSSNYYKREPASLGSIEKIKMENLGISVQNLSSDECFDENFGEKKTDFDANIDRDMKALTLLRKSRYRTIIPEDLTMKSKKNIQNKKPLPIKV